MVGAWVGHASQACVLAALACVALRADTCSIPAESVAACSVCRAAEISGARLDAGAAPVTREACIAGLAVPPPSNGVRNALAHTFAHVTYSRAAPSAINTVGAQALFGKDERHRHDGRRGLLAIDIRHDHAVVLTKVRVRAAVQKSRGKVLDAFARESGSVTFNEVDSRLEASKSFSADVHWRTTGDVAVGRRGAIVDTAEHLRNKGLGNV